jgi:glucosamine--fructose-6-phosphate aminotransferase (isomerizing)
MSEEPELRDGPPWAMEDMIEAEPGLVEPVLAAPEVAELGGLVRSGGPVVLVGCGTSEHAAMGGAAMLREAGVAAVARDAFEASLDPQEGGVVVGISHEAGTAATLAAVEAAVKRGARGALVTALADRAPGGLLVVRTPLRDASWCHTVGYLSPLLALYAATHQGAEPAPVRAAVESVMARREELEAAGAAVHGCERILAVASGADEITARELALKIEEGAHVPVTPLGIEKVLHGHLPAADERTGVIVLRLDPREDEARDRRAGNVLAATGALEMPAAVVGAGGLGAAHDVELAAPDGLPPVAGALLTGAVAAQLVTLGLVMAAGTNPDLIRREEPRYRAAAEVGGAG